MCNISPSMYTYAYVRKLECEKIANIIMVYGRHLGKWLIQLVFAIYFVVNRFIGPKNMQNVSNYSVICTLRVEIWLTQIWAAAIL